MKLFRLATFAALCGLIATASFAQDEPTTWEYAALIVESTGQVVWTSPDGQVQGLTMAAAARDIREMYDVEGDGATGGVVRLMNAVGRGGWELIDASGSQYLFKRQAE